MQRVIVSGLVFILGACASYRTPVPPKKATAPVVKKVGRVTTPVKKPLELSGKSSGSRGVWHLIFPLELEFVLRHRASGKVEFVRVETTLSDLELPSGSYVVESLIFGPEKFDALEGQELFSFEIKKKSPTYVGSYVIECPKVSPERFSVLRRMKFFNRLNFTGDTGACEMVVGNDLEDVRRAWSRLEKKPASKLLLGF